MENKETTLTEVKELKTLDDIPIPNRTFTRRILKAEAVKRAKYYKNQSLKFLGKKEIDDYGNYCYFKGKYEAEVFANNLTSEDLK